MSKTHAGDVPRVRIVCFSPAPPHLQKGGLLGWVQVEIGVLLVDGVSLRRTQDGSLAISFPTRTDRNRHEHIVVRPIDAETRRQIESQILAALRKEAVS
jgi:DNA-binding cell septation regulator SpoVG